MIDGNGLLVALLYMLLMIFFGSGIIYTVIILFVHYRRNDFKNVSYYIFSFILAGVIVSLIAIYIGYMIVEWNN